MVVSYKLSILTVALSVTIRPHFAIECLRRSNQQGPEFPGVPLGVDVWICREQTSQTNREIILEEFQPIYDHNPPTLQTDGQTDRQTTRDRKTALCTKVHHAVKINRKFCKFTDFLNSNK